MEYLVLLIQQPVVVALLLLALSLPEEARRVGLVAQEARLSDKAAVMADRAQVAGEEALAATLVKAEQAEPTPQTLPVPPVLRGRVALVEAEVVPVTQMMDTLKQITHRDPAVGSVCLGRGAVAQAV